MAKDTRVVRWTGDRGPVAHMPRERALTVNDWMQALGGSATEEQRGKLKDVTWNAANSYTVPASELAFLTDDQFQRFIVADPNFSVEKAE